jgi:hypothetical protein
MKKRPITMNNPRSKAMTGPQSNQAAAKEMFDFRGFTLGEGSIKDKRRRLEFFMHALNED